VSINLLLQLLLKLKFADRNYLYNKENDYF